MEVKGQRSGVGVFPPFGSQGSGLGYQTWRQTPFTHWAMSKAHIPTFLFCSIPQSMCNALIFLNIDNPSLHCKSAVTICERMEIAATLSLPPVWWQGESGQQTSFIYSEMDALYPGIFLLRDATGSPMRRFWKKITTQISSNSKSAHWKERTSCMSVEFFTKIQPVWLELHKSCYLSYSQVTGTL